MSLARAVAVNTGAILGSRLINTLLGVATVYLLTRFLGPRQYGIYSLLFSYLAMASVAVEFGLRAIVTREIAQQKPQLGLLVGNALLLKTGLAVAAAVILNLLLFYFERNWELLQLMAVYSLSLPLIAPTVFESVYQARLKQTIPSAIRVAQRALLLGLILLVVRWGGALIHILIMELVAGFFYVCLGFYCSLRFLKPVFRIRFSIWRQLIRDSWPLAIYALIDVFVHRVDVIMLSVLQGQLSVGIYALAVRLVEFLGIFAAAFMVSVFPVLAKSYQSERAAYHKTWQLSFRYVMAFIVPVCLLLYYGAVPLIALVAGPEFDESAVAMRILVWSQIFVFAKVVFSQILITVNQQRLLLVLISASLVLNVVLNYWWIPTLDYLGACWATVVSYGAIFPLAALFGPVRIYLRYLLLSTIRPLTGLLAAILAVHFLAQGWVQTLLLAGLVASGMAVLTRTFGREDLELVRRALRDSRGSD